MEQLKNALAFALDLERRNLAALEGHLVGRGHIRSVAFDLWFLHLDGIGPSHALDDFALLVDAEHRPRAGVCADQIADFFGGRIGSVLLVCRDEIRPFAEEK